MSNNQKTLKFRRLLSGDLLLLLILIVLSFILSLASPHFFSFGNIMNVIRQVAINFIVAIGMTCVILSAQIDLSIGSVAALAGVITAYILKTFDSSILAVTTGLAVGLAIGFLNGLLIVAGKVQSFIVTLAMMGIARGAALVITQGYPISNLKESFGLFGTQYLGPIPILAILAFVLFIIAYYFFRYTKHGLHIRAIGANIEAARLSAVNVTRYQILVFVLSGFLSALGGILITSRLLSGQPTAASGMEMDVIAAVILGGTSLSGGVGGVTGTLIGSLIIGVINNGLNLLNVSSFYQQIVKGLIILVAVLIKRRD